MSGGDCFRLVEVVEGDEPGTSATTNLYMCRTNPARSNISADLHLYRTHPLVTSKCLSSRPPHCGPYVEVYALTIQKKVNISREPNAK